MRRNHQRGVVVFIDFLFLVLLGFIAMIVWLLPHINPPAENAEADPPGNLIVAITWPEGDTDIDLWLYGPGEIKPIGYSNKSGVLFDLLRDDLGDRPDATPLNYENGYTRGITPGEYIVNIHCYRCPIVPQRVHVEVSVNTGTPGKASMKKIATTSLELTANGQEKTAMRFELTADGKLVPDSLNNIFRPLRSGWRAR
jgi:hypothetical protein